MKNIISLTVALIATALIGLTASPSFAGTRVKGYTKKDGTYVAPHHRSSPDNSKNNNYSSKGNTNPYTGKKGSVDPDKK